MNRLGARLAENEKNHRAKLAARSTADAALTVAPTKAEQSFAKDALVDRFGDGLFNDSGFDEDQRNAMIFAVAAEMKKIARDERISQPDAIQRAIDKVAPGFRNDPAFFGLIDSPSFSLTRAEALAELSEEDIQVTMERNNMSREQVIERYLQLKGIE